MSGFPPVIILAGGLGTRMNSFYPDIPKALIPIDGEPFIALQLRLLAREKVSEVILCLGHLSQQIEKYVGSGKNFGIKVNYSYDGDTLLGTGGAVLKAAQKINGPFAVLYGDSYLDTAFKPIQKAFSEANKLGLMTVYKNNNRWEKSNILSDSGLIVEYDKNKPTSKMQFIDYGLSIFQQDAFSNFHKNQPFDLSAAFAFLIANKQLAAYEVKERFYEIGSLSGLAELTNELLEKKEKR